MKVLEKERQSENRPYQNDRPGFTLIELLVILGIATLTIVGANVLHKKTGSRLAGLLGGIIGFLVIPVVGIILGLFVALVKEGIPFLPRCRNDRCRGYRDYELKRFGEDLNWVCKCGDRYDRKRCDKRFMQVTDKGEKIPFKVWRSFRGWFPDEEKPEED